MMYLIIDKRRGEIIDSRKTKRGLQQFLGRRGLRFVRVDVYPHNESGLCVETVLEESGDPRSGTLYD